MKRFGNLNSGVRLLAVALFAIPLVVLAEAAQKHELRIAIDDGTADGQLFINLDDTTGAVDLADLQVGESQSIVDDTGRAVLITRTEDGYELNVDGKTIEMPAFGTEFEHEFDRALPVDPDVTLGPGVFVMGSAAAGDGDAITIISGNTIDAATQDAIRSLLSSAGHTSNVVFIDAPQVHGITSASHDGEVRRRVIVRKDVELAH